MTVSENPVQDIDAYEFGDFCLYTKGNTTNRLRRSAKPFPLRPIEFSLLCFLVENHRREVSWEDLCKGVWGETTLENKKMQVRLHTQVYNLRENIGDDKITRTDNGYRFAAEVVEIRFTKGPSDDFEFITWVRKNTTGRSLTIRFGTGIAATVLYLIIYYLYLKKFGLSSWLDPSVVLSMIQSLMMIYALVASRSIFDRDRKDFRDRDVPLDTVVMESCGYDDPEKWKEAKSRAKDALKQYIGYWKKLLIIWGFLYLILVFTNLLNQLEPPEHYLWWSYGANITTTLLNNFNSLFIVLSFLVLNNPTIQKGESNNSPVQFIKNIEKWGRVGIPSIALIEGLIIFCFENKFTLPIKDSGTILIYDVVSGLVGGMALTLYFGRLQNKFFGLSLWLPISFSLYAVIQPLFLLIKGIGGNKEVTLIVLALLIIEMALILKCLLYIFVVWLFESGRFLFYFVRVKPIHESVDKDWEKFHSLLE